ncbi:glycosyltransferase family 2 protein [Klebsiella pneumoniae]|nr:glycosyltransferase family 2 protein [Klebsiella pneumoniae]
MKISVVIPYHNDSKTIARAIKNAINQSHQPHEIIIIDDFSDDSTQLQEIIGEIKEQTNIEIKYIRNTNNMNGAYSRNVGIVSSTGQFVALLDADDFWKSCHLEQALSTLINNKSDFVFSNIINISSDGVETIRKVTNPELLENKFDVLLHSPPQTSSFFFCREKILEAGILFDESLSRHQDYQFFLDVLNSGLKTSYLDSYSTYYYLGNGKRNLKETQFHSMLGFWEKNKNLFTSKKLAPMINRVLLDLYICLDKKRAQKIKETYSVSRQYYSFPIQVIARIIGQSTNFRKKIGMSMFYFYYNPSAFFKKIKK